MGLILDAKFTEKHVGLSERKGEMRLVRNQIPKMQMIFLTTHGNSMPVIK